MEEMNGIALSFVQTPSSISDCVFSSPFRKWRICQWPIMEASLSLKQKPIFSLLFSSYNFSLFPFMSSPSLPLGHSFSSSFLLSLTLHFPFLFHLRNNDEKYPSKQKGRVFSIACTLLCC